MATTAKDSPSKVTKPATDAATATPSAAKYKQLVKQLKANIAKQDKLEDEIDSIEHSIYSKESIYLASTANIIKGFDSYVGASTTHGRERDHNYNSLNNGTSDTNTSTAVASSSVQNALAAAAAANISVLDSNRVFSLSSATFVKQINEMNKEISRARESLEEEDDEE